MTINIIQLSTILAALRYWQEVTSHRGYPMTVEEIATNGGACEPLDADEIDELCEELNCSSTKLVTIDDVYHRYVRGISRMLRDGEEGADGEEFIMENDDAVETLCNLISEARMILAPAPTAPSPAESTKQSAIARDRDIIRDAGRILGQYAQ